MIFSARQQVIGRAALSSSRAVTLACAIIRNSSNFRLGLEKRSISDDSLIFMATRANKERANIGNAEVFFSQNYKVLRPPHTPMKWMGRMFFRLIDGSPPSLVDLPTGAGKTDLIVIWLIALAWYAQNRGSARPVPRRLVWVVNRRVLVQQVDIMAKELTEVLGRNAGPIAPLVSSLRSLCRQTTEKVFNVVQLRGQRLDDREWSLDPTMPQLIIGTVDQIGSRLLFQGYGQGKWARPMHAALFGVDSWVCIDEAHLVPAFAVTMRQIRELASGQSSADLPQTLTSFFDCLPFWTTELSATPGLPSPRRGAIFRLESEDEADEAIIDRLLAKKTRRVLWKPQPDPKALARDLAVEALHIAQVTPGSAIAVFCFKAKDAKAVAKSLNAKHKNCVLLVTGRIRGYERDRLAENNLFKRFRQSHTEAQAVVNAQPVFLVGTSAAEVGLDADASAIVCDFANLLILIQRIGRLDRRGQLSKLAVTQNGTPPTMTIIGGVRGKTTDAQLRSLAEQLRAAQPAAEFEYGRVIHGCAMVRRRW
jgi:CRISPR-associated endonuclease/helicase Cas3